MHNRMYPLDDVGDDNRLHALGKHRDVELAVDDRHEGVFAHEVNALVDQLKDVVNDG